MDPRLENYIDLLRDLSAESMIDEHMVQAVRDVTAEFLSGGVDLDPEQRVTNGTKHGRHLLYEDPCTGFCVTAMVWPPHSEGEPHDHGTWGVVGVLEGELEVTDYAPPTGEALTETGTVRATPGTVATVLPPESDVHRMRNVGDTPALSIHVYGTVIERCRAFDERTGEQRWIEPEWTSKPTGTAV